MINMKGIKNGYISTKDLIELTLKHYGINSKGLDSEEKSRLQEICTLGSGSHIGDWSNIMGLCAYGLSHPIKLVAGGSYLTYRAKLDIDNVLK